MLANILLGDSTIFTRLLVLICRTLRDASLKIVQADKSTLETTEIPKLTARLFQSGPLLVVNGLITSINGLMNGNWG